MEDNRNPWRTSYVLCTLFTAIGDTNYKMENQVREYVQERERCKSSGYGWIKMNDNGSENATALQGIWVQDFGRRIRRYKVKISLMVWRTLWKLCCIRSLSFFYLLQDSNTIQAWGVTAGMTNMLRTENTVSNCRCLVIPTLQPVIFVW